jgi:glutaredoxin
LKNPDSKSLLTLLALVVGVGFAMQLYRDRLSDGLGRQAAAHARPGDIQMLSSVTCPYCDRARAWFEQHGVAFSECFIERDEACAARFHASLAYGTPTLFVKGRRLVGFSAQNVLDALTQ